MQTSFAGEQASHLLKKKEALYNLKVKIKRIQIRKTFFLKEFTF